MHKGTGTKFCYTTVSSGTPNAALYQQDSYMFDWKFIFVSKTEIVVVVNGIGDEKIVYNDSCVHTHGCILNHSRNRAYRSTC